MAQFSIQLTASDSIVPEYRWNLNIPEIRFGQDSIKELGDQLTSLRVAPGGHGLVITDETLVGVGHADLVRDVLEAADFTVDVYEGVQREPHVDDIDVCLTFARENGDYDFVIGMGGGSAMDTAKVTRAILPSGKRTIDHIVEPDGNGEPLPDNTTPLVLIPTTGGSPVELTPHSIIKVGDDKKSRVRGECVRTDVTLLDPALTVTMPPELTAQTAMDAFGGVFESYTAPALQSRVRRSNVSSSSSAGRTRLSDMFAEEAIALLASGLRTVVHNETDIEARSEVMLGSLYAAIASQFTGAHLGHAVTYAVQARYHTFHSKTIGVMTPASTLGFNVGTDPKRFVSLAELLGASTDGLQPREAANLAGEEFVRLQRDLGVLPSGLEELVGITEADNEEIEALATETIENQGRLLQGSPRSASKDDLIDVFRDAIHNWD